MKFSLSFYLLLLTCSVFGQISYDVNSDHVSFTNNFTMEELSHWTPLNIEFMEEDLGRTGTFASNYIQFNNTAITENTLLENGRLIIQKPNNGVFPATLQTRMLLNDSELKFTNDNSWETFRVYSNIAKDGVVDIRNSSGGLKIRMNTNTANVGSITTYGIANTQLVSLTSSGGRGYVGVADTDGGFEAGIYVNAGGEGIVFGDTKNFRVKHPEKSNKEIWYASLEGPEVGAYDRGTAQLESGEVFIPFKDHFKHIANTKNMTVQLTPHEWDTYGLAVVEKTTEGFIVKELKGGNGDFSFDWEVKCVRAGKEKFQVVRDEDPNLSPATNLPIADYNKKTDTPDTSLEKSTKSKNCKH